MAERAEAKIEDPTTPQDIFEESMKRAQEPAKRQKFCYIGAPKCFALEQACKQLKDAFPEISEQDHIGIYIVGSVLERHDWRDVDVRMMMDDASFARLFPTATLHSGAWEFDPRWCLMTVAISRWLSEQTGLPVDFQFQMMSHANKHHKGARQAVGLRFKRPELAALGATEG